MIDMPPLDDRVLIALEQNPYLSRRNLRFETNEGRVTLRGIVGSYFQKQMAQEAIRHVAGVEKSPTSWKSAGDKTGNCPRGVCHGWLSAVLLGRRGPHTADTAVARISSKP